MGMDLETAIQAVRNGDTSAYATVIEETERRLRAHLALQVPDRDLVDEVAHQAYITAYQKLNEYQAGTNFFAWVKRIAVFHLRNECRKRQHHAGTALERLNVLVAPGPEPDERAETSDQVDQLRKCLDKMGPEARQLLDLRYKEALEPSEIAPKVGKAASHVRTILVRLRQALQKCMETEQHA